MRILVVDDAEDSRDIIEAALLSGGYDDIATAASGWEAIKFLDIGCDGNGAPAADGLDVIRLAQGEAAVRMILTQVARAVRQTAASIGIVAASYRNGMITVV